MAATETRLLLLGGVLLFEPVNGYQLRRELLSWQVEDRAHIDPGSIYSGLSTLTRQGTLTATTSSLTCASCASPTSSSAASCG